MENVLSQRIIEIEEYKPTWVDDFERHKFMLEQAIGVNAVTIEHIGSTSIPGLAAKPIIDMLIEVSCLEELDGISKLIWSLGFEVKGENGITGRRYFQKGGNKRTHHAHAFKTGDNNLLRHRAFRDYLIAHPLVADKYSHLKKEAARKCNNDVIVYMNCKNDFILHHEKLAVEWYGN